MAGDSDDRTLTTDEPVGASLPQPPTRRLVAPLQLRDPDRYEVLDEHGRGGLGIVSRAHDQELGRDVAIKELLSRGDAGELRFLREALITARLEHPGIVPIHEAGRWPDGTPFYVMKLVAGRSLKELIAERQTVEVRLELLHHVIAVADAVAYAHKRNIIHRDLKASNVIAGDFGETIVIDWGLAKDLTAADEIPLDKGPFRTPEADELTATGDVLGTPMYMAPEQRRGEAVDQRAEQANHELVLQNVELQLRPDPTTAFRTLAKHHDTDDVRSKMLRAEAEGRGVAVAELTPHSDSIWFLTGNADGAVYSLGEDRRIQETRGNTSTTLAADVSPARIYDYSAAEGLLAYARTPSGIGLLDLTARSPRSIQASALAAIALAPDGSRLAALGADGRLTVWSLPSEEVIFEHTLPDRAQLVFAGPSTLIVHGKAVVQALALDRRQPEITIATPSLTSLHARNEDVITGDESGNVALLSRTLKPIARLSVCHQRVNSVRLAARAKRVAFACQDGLVGIARYDELRGEMRVADTFPTGSASLYAEPDPLGARVVAVTDSNVVYLYDLESRLATRYEGHAGRVSAITAPGSSFEHVLSGDVNGTVRIWEIPPRNARVILQAPDAVYGAEFSPDGKVIATDGTDGIVRRISIADGGVTELEGHKDIVLRTRFSPDGQSFLSLSRDGTIRIWSLTSERPLHVFSGHEGIVGDAEYIEGGRRIASVGDDGRLLLWSPKDDDGVPLFTHRRPLGALEVLARNGHIVVHDSEGGAWDIAPGGASRQIRTADGHAITKLRASPDGSLLAIGTGAGEATIYDTREYRVIHRETMTTGIRQVAFDPQNRDLVIASEDGHVRSVALDRRRTLPWRDLAVAARSVAYSEDGETIAIVCRDGGAWLYSQRENSWVYTHDHTTNIISGRFSPDGTLFSSTDSNGMVVIRDVTRTFATRKK